MSPAGRILQTVLVGIGVTVAAGLWLFPDQVADLRLLGQARVHGEPGCDLVQTPCAAALPSGDELTVALSPRPFTPGSRLTATVDAPEDAERVVVDLRSTSMNMGLSRFILEADGEGSFTGPAMIPACTTDRMTWRLDVSLVRPGEPPVVATFDFATTGPS